jgi:hypothetical protein
VAKSSNVWLVAVTQLAEKSFNYPILVGSGPARSSIVWPTTTAQLVGKLTNSPKFEGSSPVPTGTH